MFLLQTCGYPRSLTAFSPPFSVQRGGRVEIIANDQGHRITPSWVAFTDEERLYVFSFLSLTFHLVLTQRSESVTRPKTHSTPTLPTQSLTLSVSSVVRLKSPSYSVTLNTGGFAFFCVVLFGLIYF